MTKRSYLKNYPLITALLIIIGAIISEMFVRNVLFAPEYLMIQRWLLVLLNWGWLPFLFLPKFWQSFKPWYGFFIPLLCLVISYSSFFSVVTLLNAPTRCEKLEENSERIIYNCLFASDERKMIQMQSSLIMDFLE